MKYSVVLSQEAQQHFAGLSAFDRAAVKKAMAEYLTSNPARVSKSRIKKLRQPAPVGYRLRVNDFRVYYSIDVEALSVTVLAILEKRDTYGWLQREKIDDND